MRKITFVAATLTLILGISAPVFAETGVELLLRKQEERMRERLLRWKDICDRREERREERLQLRGMVSSHTASDADRACEAIRKKLEDLDEDMDTDTPSPSPSPNPSPNPNPTPSDDLLPNQRFQPAPPFPVIDVRSRILVLGETGPIAGTIKLNPQDEPVEVREIRLTLSAAVDSLSSFEVFDELGFVLGSATRNLSLSSSGNVYTLSLSPDQAYFIDKNDEVIVAFRPRLKDDNSGGESGEDLQISGVMVTAIGQWSSRTNLVTTTGPDFKAHQTALTTIMEISRVGEENGVFATGSERLLGSFFFDTADVADGDAEPRLLEIIFSLSHSSQVTVSNAVLRDSIGGTETDCTVSSSEITCSSIPEDVGSIEGGRELSLYADVDLSGSINNPFLQLDINRPGGPSSAGDITWTDGESTFTWVPFGQPVAQGPSLD